VTYVEKTALEFFAGIGLARMGLEAAGWEVVFANDNDPKKLGMHEGHWGPDPRYVLKDIFELEAAQIPSAELAWASFPCIDLSLAGNRAGLDGKHSSAFWGFARILNELRTIDRLPPLLILENVTGMLTSHGGDDLVRIIVELNDLGFMVDLLELDAAHFVPQSRPRLFVIAAREPYRLLPFMEGATTAVRPTRVTDFIKRHSGLQWGSVPVGQLPERSVTFDDIAERFPDDADIWWKPDAVAKLLSQMSARHDAVVKTLLNSPQTHFLTIYRRVRRTGCMAEARFDGVAGCLRTPRGGSSKQFVLEVGGGRVRARNMTAIEYGRLQGAGNYKIQVPINQALFGFGDAVCVPAVTWLAENCIEPIRRSSLVREPSYA